jgi:hypothetical protein
LQRRPDSPPPQTRWAQNTASMARIALRYRVELPERSFAVKKTA